MVDFYADRHIFMVYYGLSIKNLPLILANGISILSLLIIMAVKYVYR